MAAAQRCPVERRNPALVGRERRAFECQARDIGGAASGRKQMGEPFDLRRAIPRVVPDHDLVAVARDLGRAPVSKMRTLRRKYPWPHATTPDRTVAHAAAASEHLDADAQPMQRLSEFETDHAGTEHRHAVREVVKFENVVVGEQTLPSAFHAAGKDGEEPVAMTIDDARTVTRSSIASVCIVDESGATMNLVAFWNAGDTVGNEPDETVALAANARHDRLAVDLDPAREFEAKALEPMRRVRGFRGRDPAACWACSRPARTSCRGGRLR